MEKPENDLVQERRKKLEELRAKGINPYPYKYDVTHHAADILAKYAYLQAQEHTTDRVSVAGRIMTFRDMGKLVFGHIQDASGKIQFLCKQDKNPELFALLKLLDLGDIVGVAGIIFKTKTGETTIEVHTLEILCKSLRPLPDKWHGIQNPEIKYRKRHLDLIMNPEVRQVFEDKAKILSGFREFLDKRGYIEVETPILQPIYGGANARPFITHQNALNFDMYLKISPELYLKRLIVGGFERVYDLGKCFRNEGIDKTHNPEFGMIEWYQAYADYNDIMHLVEDLFIHLSMKLHGKTEIEYQGKIIDFKKPWKRITMIQALQDIGKIDVTTYDDEEIKELITTYNLEIEGEVSKGTIIQALFEQLVEAQLTQPTFVIDHPIETSPLTKVHRKNPQLVERFELFINGWELANGYSELSDPIDQRKRLESQAEQSRAGYEEAQPMDEDFVQAIEQGMPPTGGVGVGFDRLAMLLTNQTTIRDIILFPTMKPQPSERVEHHQVDQ